jgi:hypothetical protein
MIGDLSLAISAQPLFHHLWTLLVAALLGAALGVMRPVRREIVPRSAHVVHAQILLAIVGAMIIIVVAESLARARDRRRRRTGAGGHRHPKDAGVMLIALAVGLTRSGQLWFAAVPASSSSPCCGARNPGAETRSRRI